MELGMTTKVSTSDKAFNVRIEWKLEELFNQKRLLIFNNIIDVFLSHSQESSDGSLGVSCKHFCQCYDILFDSIK